MPRSRTLKPSFFKNETLAACQPLSRILFSGLWCLADRSGRIEDRPARIKIETLPYDECDINKLIDELVTAGFLSRYKSGGVGVIQIANWEKHAKPYRDEPESTLPAINVKSKSHKGTSDGLQRNIRGTSDAPPMGQEGTPQEHQTGQASLSDAPTPLILIPSSSSLPSSSLAQDPSASSLLDPPLAGFDLFWSLYPRKVAKADAVKAWEKLGPDDELQRGIFEAVKLQTKSRQWANREYVPYPATWLNGKRWNDVVEEEKRFGGIETWLENNGEPA